MRPYVIYAPPYHSGSAGIVVMHRFGQELLKKGMEVYLNTYVQNPKWPPLPVCSASYPQDHIAIYPEIVNGNPFHATKVVRYLLCVPGFWGGPTSYDPSDLLFVYNDHWKNEILRELGIVIPDDRVLFIPDLIERDWPNLGLTKEYNLWYRGKGKQPEVPQISGTSQFLGHNTQFNGEDMQMWLRLRLSKCDIFYTYDVATALWPIALFCGCQVHVVPDPNRVPSLPWDITEEKMREYYRMKEAELPDKMDKFIEITQGE